MAGAGLHRGDAGTTADARTASAVAGRPGILDAVSAWPVSASVRRAGDADVVAVAEVLADAFSAADGYPWTRWTIDDDDHRRRIRDLQLLALEHVGMPYGTVWAAHCDGAIRAAAVWLDPTSVPIQAQQAVDLRRSVLEGRRHAASVEAEAVLAAGPPVDPHFLLATVGTAPSHRNLGFASAVVSSGLEEARRRGLPARLETSSEENVAWYQRLGFRQDGPVVDIPGGPSVWRMLHSS